MLTDKEAVFRLTFSNYRCKDAINGNPVRGLILYKHHAISQLLKPGSSAPSISFSFSFIVSRVRDYTLIYIYRCKEHRLEKLMVITMNEWMNLSISKKEAKLVSAPDSRPSPRTWTSSSSSSSFIKGWQNANSLH